MDLPRRRIYGCHHVPHEHHARASLSALHHDERPKFRTQRHLHDRQRHAPPGVSGPIIVEGRWESGPWYELASTNASDGGFRVRYGLRRPGVVHVRLALPNGNYAVRTIDVT